MKLAFKSIFFLMCFAFSAQATTLTLITTRKQTQLQPLLDLFKKENPEVDFAYAKGKNWDLIAHLEKEGAASRADVFLTKDLVYLTEAAEKELLSSFDSPTVRRNIPLTKIWQGPTGKPACVCALL